MTKKQTEPKPAKDDLFGIPDHTCVYATRDDGEDIPQDKSGS